MLKKKTLVTPPTTARMEGSEVRVKSVDDVGEETVALELSAPEGWEFSPGQFVQVGAPVKDDFVVRHYTVSSPYSNGRFEITVEVDPDGDLSPVLASLERGEYVSVDGPFGNAYYEGEEGVVVLAGGPGVGPAVGIAERVSEEKGAENVSVVYRDDEPAHTDRLGALREEGATISIIGDGEGLRDAVEKVVGGDEQVFVYGFDGFVQEALEALDSPEYDGEPKVENFG